MNQLDQRSAVDAHSPPGNAFEGEWRLSVAAPAFNEAASIRSVVIGWIEYLRRCEGLADFEIVVCDDGSRDGTGELLHALAIAHREVRPLHFVNNRGAAAALAAAIAVTRFDWVLLIDSDGQFPIENLAAMVAAVRSRQVPAAIGVRRKQGSSFARFGTVSSALVCNLLHRSSLSDFNSAFKLVWGPLLRSLVLEARGMNYSTEITSRLLESGTTIAEVEIEHRPRLAGTSNMRLFRDTLDRALFVAYIALRQVLFGAGVLRRPLS